ncbi:MAG: hypothetical protein ACK56I_37115, partial [bacterium]
HMARIGEAALGEQIGEGAVGRGVRKIGDGPGQTSRGETAEIEDAAQHAEFERRDFGRGRRHGHEFSGRRRARKRFAFHMAEESGGRTRDQRPERTGDGNNPPRGAEHLEGKTPENLAGEQLH